MGVTLNPLGPPFDFTGAGGGGGGTITGTIADQQVAFGSAANTIDGDPAFLFDDTSAEWRLKIGGGTSVEADAPIDVLLAMPDQTNWQLVLMNSTFSTNPNDGLFGGVDDVGEISFWWRNYAGRIGFNLDGMLVSDGTADPYTHIRGAYPGDDVFFKFVSAADIDSGSTYEQAFPFIGFVTNADDGCNAVAVYGYAHSNNTTAPVWGANFVAVNHAGAVGSKLVGMEIDVVPLAGTTLSSQTGGLFINGFNLTNIPVALQIGCISGGTWTNGIVINDIAAGGAGILVHSGTIVSANAILPENSDGAALGSTSKQWSDLFLAEGGVINWDNGDVTITQTNNVLAVVGTTSVTFDAAIAAASTATVGTATGTTGAVLFKGTTSGTVTLSVADAAGTWTMKLPTTAGTSGYSLTTDGSGNTTWTNVSGGSGATTALDNLASVAINAALLLGTSDAAALGSATKMWSDLFLAPGAVVNFNNGDVTATHGSGTLTIGGSAANGVNLTLAAGGTSRASLSFPASTLTTTPADGDVEMDANCFYHCTDAGNRGYVPVVYMIRQAADRAAFANDTNQQAIFDSVTNGTLTLETGTYEFEGVIQCKGMSATSGNLKFSVIGAGTATLGTILRTSSGFDAANEGVTTASGVSSIQATQTAANIATAAIATVVTFTVNGSFEVTVAGTIIPSVAQTTATTTAVITAGSYLRFNRIGAAGVVSVGQWT